MSTMTVKGQVTIPKAIRDKLGLKPGQQVEFVEIGDRIELRPAPRATPWELGKHLFGKYSSGRSDSSKREVRKRIAAEAMEAKHARRAPR